MYTCLRERPFDFEGGGGGGGGVQEDFPKKKSMTHFFFGKKYPGQGQVYCTLFYMQIKERILLLMKTSRPENIFRSPIKIKWSLVAP